MLNAPLYDIWQAGERELAKKLHCNDADILIQGMLAAEQLIEAGHRYTDFDWRNLVDSAHQAIGTMSRELEIHLADFCHATKGSTSYKKSLGHLRKLVCHYDTLYEMITSLPTKLFRDLDRWCINRAGQIIEEFGIRGA